MDCTHDHDISIEDNWTISSRWLSPKLKHILFPCHLPTISYTSYRLYLSRTSTLPASCRPLHCMRAKMDGLIPFVLKALKKKTMRHYRFLSSSSHLEDSDVTEPSPQGSFMTPQHPRAPSRWHGGDGNIFMTPQHPKAASRLDEGDDNGEPPAPVAAAAAVPRAMVPTVVQAKSGNMRRRLPITRHRHRRSSGTKHSTRQRCHGCMGTLRRGSCLPWR